MIGESELIINDDGSVFHLHIRPEELADDIILVGDPGRVDMISGYLDDKEFRRQSREFVTVTGKYRGKRLTVLSTGIGTDNIDIVMNELDARCRRLDGLVAEASAYQGSDLSHFYQKNVLGQMQGVRQICDELELIVDQKAWPYPTYGEMLFYI